MYSTCVVTSIKNGENYIDDYFKTILNQTVLPNKIYICNDGSVDLTLTKIFEYSDKMQIEIINHLAPKGLTFSLHELLNCVSEDLIFRLDVDDLWDKNHIENLLKIFNHDRTKILYFSYPNLFPHLNISEIHEEISDNFLHGNTILHSAVMLNNIELKSHEINYDLKYDFAQDYELWSRIILLNGFQFICDNSVVVRQNGDNISYKFAKEQLFFMKKARQIFLIRNLLRAYRKPFQFLYLLKLLIYYFLK